MDFQTPHDSEHSQTSVDFFFDTLQSWALNYVQICFEPISKELLQVASPSDPHVIVPESSLAAHCTELVETKVKHSKQDLSNTCDAALPVKQQSSEKKMREDVEFIISNVSSDAVWFCTCLTSFTGQSHHLEHQCCLLF